MKLELVKLNKDVKIPKYETKNSAGFDLVANNFKMLYETHYEEVTYENVENIAEHNYDSIMLQPSDRLLIGTGFKVKVPEGYEMQIRPRSGIALKNGISVVNTPGTIDADYRGEVGVVLINHSEIPFKVKLGDRIAQGVINKIKQIEFNEVDELSKTDRGEGGFGSTGK